MEGKGGYKRFHSPRMQADAKDILFPKPARNLPRMKNVRKLRLPVSRPCRSGFEIDVVEDDASFGSEFCMPVARDVDDADGAGG